MMIKSEPQKKIYKKNFITNVIFRIDFPKILNLTEQNPPSKLQEIINEKFPRLEEIKGSQIETKIMKNSTFDIKGITKISWSFINREKTINISIDPEFLTIEYLKYENFTEFFKTIKFIFDNFIDLYNIKLINRLGLRYINQIKLEVGNPLNWNNLIDASLFSVSENFVKKNYRNNISRSMHFLGINEEEYNLIFQFGMHNSEYPSPINRKEFILDYDCMSKEEIDVIEVLNKVEKFNKIIYEWFESSIMNKLREEMGVIKNES